MIPRSADVVVVGAGPVGLAVAVGLRMRGHSVVVVDKQSEGANTSRAAVIHARTLEMLEEIGATRPLVELGLTLHKFVVRAGDRRLISINFRDLPTDYPFILMIPQSTTEGVLLSRLEELGGSVARPISAVGLTQTSSGVEVTLEGGDTITARYVVAADGMNSTIRELTGLQMPGNTLPLSFSLADVRFDNGPVAEEVALCLAADGLLVVAPLPDGSLRLVASVDDAPERPDAAFAQHLVSTRGWKTAAPRVAEVIWGSRFRIHERVADSYRAGRVLLAGDAAHTHSPAGGQGMNLGLRDAVTLAAALDIALKDGLETDLDAYAIDARDEAVRVIALTHRLTRMANLPRPLRPLRNVALRVAAKFRRVRVGLAHQLSGIPIR